MAVQNLTTAVNANANALGSNYKTTDLNAALETRILKQPLDQLIFDNAPAQFNALKLLFQKDYIEYGSDEFSYLEKGFGRAPLIGTTPGVVATSASGNTVVTQTIPMADTSNVSLDMVIVYPNGDKGVVKTITSNTSIVVNSLRGKGLPAVTTGDVFAVLSGVTADGDNAFSLYQRDTFIERFNYIQLFSRARRWGDVELLKYKNQQQVNYLDRDKQEVIRQIRTDLFNALFNGTRGTTQTTRGIEAKTMGGIFPTMVAAGSMSASPTTAGLRSAFEALAFETNHKAEGGTRFIYGTAQAIHKLASAYVDSKQRYAPNDKIAQLNLDKYSFGSMNFVPVTCELFRNTACFPAEWANRLLVLDQETISPVKMKGLPTLAEDTTIGLKTRERFKDYFVDANLSVQFNNPLASFYIDIAA